MALKTTLWDSAAHLKTQEDIQLYLEAFLEETDNDPMEILHVLSIVARARNMSQIAREAGLSREGLYKALAPDANPSFATVIKITQALGLKLTIQSCTTSP